MYVVYTQQMCTCSFFCCDMVNVGARETQTAVRRRSTDGAFAVWVHSAEVICVGGVAEIQHA